MSPTKRATKIEEIITSLKILVCFSTVNTFFNAVQLNLLIATFWSIENWEIFCRYYTGPELKEKQFNSIPI